MQTKKANSILAKCSEETFEFSEPRTINGDRIVSNVQNHSHDDGEAHIYPVFFDVAQDGLIFGAHVAECGCPADEYHDGACKHREAASECAELLARVLSVTSADESDNADHEQESAAVDGEKEQSGRTTIADGGREIGEWANRGGMPCPHRMSAAIELVRRWAIEYDEAKEFLRGVGFREDGGGERLVTDGGQPVEYKVEVTHA